jgi:hypothetical protein
VSALNKLDELLYDLHSLMHRSNAYEGMKINEVLMLLTEAKITLEKAFASMAERNAQS